MLQKDAQETLGSNTDQPVNDFSHLLNELVKVNEPKLTKGKDYRLISYMLKQYRTDIDDELKKILERSCESYGYKVSEQEFTGRIFKQYIIAMISERGPKGFEGNK